MNRFIKLPINHRRRYFLLLITITLAAFALRMVGLAEIPPRWDEGWTVAHASLDIVSLLTITAADVHPPLFYLLLGAWQSTIGVGVFTARYLAVLVSVPAIPLAYAVARTWHANKRAQNWRLALLAAALMAWLPLGVYYGAVIRMYALAPSLVLLATWAGLRMASGHVGTHPRRVTIAFVIGTAGAMLTLYHAVWALAALGFYLLLMTLARHNAANPHRITLLAIGALLSAAVFTPWGIYAIPQLLSRAAAGSLNVAQQYSFAYFLKVGLNGLTMSQQTGLWGIGVMLAVSVTGVICAIVARTWSAVDRLALPVLMLLFTLAGVAFAARNWTINERMLICAVPALALLLAWALDQLVARSHLLGAIAIIALVGVYFTTSTSFVYKKTLEVFEPYNPHIYSQHLSAQAHANDLVVFNVLSPAGFYMMDRKDTDPAWTYALTWDPVIEPRARWEVRIADAAKTHPRLWLVLYRGLAGRNGDLRGWLDTNFYPAQAMWGEEEVYYGLYGSNSLPMRTGTGNGTHWLGDGGFDLELRSVQLAATVPAGDIVPVALTWHAGATLNKNLKVFVHAFDESGNLIAQHDAQPLNDLRPMTSFPAGVDVDDHHGLELPQGFTGRLRIVVGLYDPATNNRSVSSSGMDAIEIGHVDVLPAR